MNLKKVLYSNVIKHSGSRAIATKLGRMNTRMAVHSPDIYIGTGIVLGGVSAVLLARAYKRHESVTQPLVAQLTHRAETVENWESDAANEFTSEMTFEEANADAAKALAALIWGWVKLYGPAAVTATLSIGFILRGHKIQRGRAKAMAAALLVFQEALSEYRGRVADKVGEEVEESLWHKLHEEVVTTVTKDEKGRNKKHKETVRSIGHDGAALYSRIFDKSLRDYVENREFNHFLLEAKEAHWNTVLAIKGHVLLNDVYEGFGIPRSPEGAVVGWSLLAPGDNFIDFGLRKPVNSNDQDPRFLLDFNVNGVIVELI